MNLREFIEQLNSEVFIRFRNIGVFTEIQENPHKSVHFFQKVKGDKLKKDFEDFIKQFERNRSTV